jgi:hypothetical protein
MSTIVTESTNTALPENNNSPQTEAVEKPAAWKTYQKILFRIAFIFFVIMSIPWNSEWYKNLFTMDWTSLHYRDLYDIARFSPSFVRGEYLP